MVQDSPQSLPKEVERVVIENYDFEVRWTWL